MEGKQIYYLYAPSHLNPTYEYGVTFERGTVVEYGDRAHALISGTASINNKGEVVHVGDIDGQTRRMIENVKVLLDEGGFAETDVAQIIVYIRDLCDFERVKQLINEHYANVPQIFTLAPVCRPEWLVEMECIAIKKNINAEFRAF
jgi:enamine deaminase RidA (YjgF/YER057c/UK114 family)